MANLSCNQFLPPNPRFNKSVQFYIALVLVFRQGGYKNINLVIRISFCILNWGIIYCDFQQKFIP